MMQNIKTTQKEIEKFLDPEEIISQLNIETESVVADFGCGPGYFSLPFSKAVGEKGKVYALDVLSQALETVQSKAKNSGILNIETKRVNLEKENGSKMDSDSFDWVIMKDILFQNQNKEIIVSEAHRILRVGGRVLVIEWKKSGSTVGPESGIRISEDELEKIFLDKGFNIEKNINAGDFHYAFVAVK